MSGRDRQKLDQYLTSVRDIEQRIERAERHARGHSGYGRPAGIPRNFGEHVQLMFDMLLLAFQTDSTRVATFLGWRGSNRSFSEIGVSEGHHNLPTTQRAEIVAKVKRIDLWYATQLANSWKKWSDQRTNGQSLLHNSMIVYGSGNADGNRHTHTNLPILLAGSAGGALQSRAYLKTPADAADQPVS